MKAVRLLLILLFVIPKHVIAEENSNQLLLTQYPATKKWGYTYNKSKTSRMFLPTRLTATSAFSAVGLGTSLIWGKKDRLAYNWAIPPQYDQAAKNFEEGLAAVIMEGRMGFINSSNQFVIPPIYKAKKLTKFNYGLAPVMIEGKYGFIDKLGNLVIPNRYEWADSFKDNGLASVKMEGKYGTIDLNGELVVPCTYQLEEAMTTVPVSNKDYRQAVKDVKAKLDSGVYSVLTQRLDSISAKVDSKEVEFSKGLIAPDDQPFFEQKGSFYGARISEKDSIWLFKPEYIGIEQINDGFFLLFAKDSLCGVGDSFGRIIVPCEYEDITYDRNGHAFVVQEKEHYGFYGIDGLIRAFTGFDLIGGFADGTAPIWVDNETGTVTEDGTIDPEFIQRLYVLGETAEKNGDTQRARQLYARIIKIEPTFAMAYNNFGLLELKSEAYSEGMSKLKLAHELAPENEQITANYKQARKDQKSRRWDKVISGLETAGTLVGVAATTYAAIEGDETAVTALNEGRSLTAEELATTALKSSESASVNEDIYDFENMQVKATSSSQIEKEKQKLQQLYVQREAIIARSKNTQRTISSEGSKQVRRAGTSLRMNHGQVRPGQGNYGRGAADRHLRETTDNRVELRNINQRIERQIAFIQHLEEGGSSATFSAPASRSTKTGKFQKSGPSQRDKITNDHTYRNWETQLIRMSTGTDPYDDSKRKYIQSQMRSLRAKYGFGKSQWEDWGGK
ncbi:WG repeat-containing protein [Parabacteroides merdae]|jgi:hypothetical protein|uniref:WG repeat-containing protein n=1 Tax=Parabacteroides merdae TaxID=46503 RepID=UPI001B53D659|nr:WG repeat-containing protein [Parabacteroides sp.]